MHNLKLIIQREFLARVRNRTFIIMTFLSPVILVGMVFLIAYLSMLNRSEREVIAVKDDSGIIMQELEETERLKFTEVSGLSLEQAKVLTREEGYTGLLYIPEIADTKEFEEPVRFFASSAPSFGLLQKIETAISDKLTTRELLARGVDPVEIEAAQTNVSVQVENFEGQRTSRMAGYVKMLFGGAAGYLLMMFIIIYGSMVMRSVIEEKSNRIIEIIISSVKPIQLMLGKIVGTSLAGIAQFAIWVVLGAVLLILAGSVSGIPVAGPPPEAQEAIGQIAGNNELQQLLADVANLPLLSLVLFFLVYFIGGYFLYSAVYAAIGAAVDSETDTQQFIFPIILPLILGIYVGFFSVIENPHGTISVIFSMIPFTSPIVMLMRIPFGVAWWELVISLLLLFLTNAAMLWMGAKIYRVGILMYGKKPTYKELYKWLKY